MTHDEAVTAWDAYLDALGDPTIPVSEMIELQRKALAASDDDLIQEDRA